MEKDIKIKYSYPKLYLYQKPAVVLASIIGLIGLFYYFMNSDFSIIMDPKKQLLIEVEKVKVTVRTFEYKETELLGKLGQLLKILKEDKNYQKFEESEKTILEFCKVTGEKLLKYSERKELGEYGLSIKKLVGVMQDRIDVTKKKTQAWVKFYKEKRSGEKEMKKLDDVCDEFDKELEVIDRLITRML
jgi:sulfite reductase alpha subunit-like flavoprotein